MTEVEVAEAAGYNVAPSRPPFRTRLWRARVWILCAALLLILLGLALTRPAQQDPVALSTLNPKDNGSMAVAEILRDNGVGVREIAYLSRARIQNPQQTTLVVALPRALSADQLESVLSYPGDVVFVGISSELVEALGGILFSANDDGAVRTANCSDDDAAAAERVSSEARTIESEFWGDTVVCFANADGGGSYAVVKRDGHTRRLIADPYVAMNDHLTENGNAALILRAAGHHPNVIWYVGAFDDVTHLTFPNAPAGPSGPVDPTGDDFTPSSSGDLLPRGTTDAIYALVLAGFVAAIWRARRMGSLVGESLPVIVRASESTRARGRMYRRARAYGRASAALRAAAAERMGRRLGIARSASAIDLIASVARASGREAVGVERLIFGPPPASEAAMMDLAKELDALEREVHRP